MGKKYIKNRLNVIAIYFSKDRPLQLDLTINSNHLNCQERNKIQEVVLYKASDGRYKKAYEKLANFHPKIEFIQEEDFKTDLVSILQRKKYVLFIVDDTIFTDTYSVEDMIFTLEEDNACLGFSLRLGYNSQFCYPINQKNKMPIFETIISEAGICKFNWTYAGIGDFSYPLEVSSSLYKVSDLGDILNFGTFNSPNSLESLFYANLSFFSRTKPRLLCYRISKAFSNPVNKVQTENNNRVGKNFDYSPNNLLNKFEKNYMIDVMDFYKFVSTGCHQEVEFNFTKRR